MDTIFTEFMQKIQAGSGFTLSIVGMTVVFIGLITLFVTMIILQKVMTHFNGKGQSLSEPAAEAPEEDDEINMDEAAAAIAIAFKLHTVKNSHKNITIKRVSRSLWKESKRALAMERL